MSQIFTKLQPEAAAICTIFFCQKQSVICHSSYFIIFYLVPSSQSSLLVAILQGSNEL